MNYEEHAHALRGNKLNFNRSSSSSGHNKINYYIYIYTYIAVESRNKWRIEGGVAKRTCLTKEWNVADLVWRLSMAQLK